ncbi:ATP-dependent protease La [Dendrothele bispora CBS 962.96]|uniref:endopeptidase La n=1 Tax=Dendrothele bispora (strain CBS 962.96) TaxID=1314807 RepID=A0A4S8MLQ2_DENBC|nr:ATP-dependent protease La [Dendrothele bispora CBS 962.96]
MSRPTELPILPLPYPYILLPASRITVPLPSDVGEAVLALVEKSDTLPIVAALPTTNPSSHPSFSQFGTAARVLRLVQPPSATRRNSLKSGDKQPQTYLVSLQGLTRICLGEGYDQELEVMRSPVTPSQKPKLLVQSVTYPSTTQVAALKDGSTSEIEAVVQGHPRDTIVKFKVAALKVLQHLAQNVQQQSKKDAYYKISTMLEDLKDDVAEDLEDGQNGNRENLERAAWMADVLVGNVLPTNVRPPSNEAENEEWADKLALLTSAHPLQRLDLATIILNKLYTKLEVTSRIASAVDESLSKQQKEFFLRQQMRAIEKELRDLQSSPGSGGDASGISSSRDQSGPSGSSKNSRNTDLDFDTNESEDVELMDIRKKLEAMEHGSEERKAGVREWRRLRRLMGGSGAGGGGGGGMSVEGGVLRGWLEWLTALPWPTIESEDNQSEVKLDLTKSSTSSFLAAARAQLDQDHYGLDKVKKRLVEYLAIVRLKELQEAAEMVEEDGKRLKLEKERAEKAAAEVKPENMQLVKYQPDSEKEAKPESERRVRRKKGVKGPILLFVGPPGTGKTSLGQSIARALDRPFQRISLGGVRDEAEIRGHRRTYVASGPGLIVQALRKAGRPDFVCLLDEIDKLGANNFHGDPGAALLEVLDPEQNCAFNDHYINVPIDLSQVLFICTANSLETISDPLLDRMETVVLPGYTYDEKQHIAKRFLLPKQLKVNGMSEEHVKISDEALKTIATKYTREAGVRTLDRSIGAVVRYKAVEWAEVLDDLAAAGLKVSDVLNTAPITSSDDSQTLIKVESKEAQKIRYKPIVEASELEQILGIARGEDGDDSLSERNSGSRRGVVYGLVVMGQGEGGILPVESIVVPAGGQGGSGEGGRLRLTGSLGDVIKESGELALSWVKTRAYDLGLTTSRYQDPLKGQNPIDIHLHLPAGAQKKDGPSAGVTMTCALVSLLTGACVPPDVAMTGEITLRGRVTPVGGIKEKVLGAHRAQIRKVILPYANRKDVEQDVAMEVRREMEFVFVRTLEETLEAAFGKNVIGWRRDIDMLESRL